MENLDKLPVVTNPKPKDYEIGDQVNFILGRIVYGGFVLLKYDSNLYRVNSVLGQYDIPGEPNGTPDWQAREAYRNKTAELLNVIL